jgi:signal transduction histidine kinase
VVGLLERQRARIEASRAALVHRAESLADELQALGDCMGDALLSIDESGRIASLNPSGAALLGIDPETQLGRPWQEVLAPDPVSRRRVAETLDSGAPQRGVTMVLSPAAGRSLTVRAEMWLGAGRDGRRAHLLLDPGSDAVSDDPVRRLGESAACVAHQIKNSMHALEGFVQRLDHEPHDLRQDSATAQCLGALHHLGRLAEDVLTMAGAPRPKRETVAIQEVLRSAVVLLGQAPIRMTLPTPPVFVEVHRSMLVHAVFNLLDNAVQMSPPGRPVEVSVGRRDDSVVVDIDDAGPGMPEGFAPSRGPLPSRNGAGLGLMAARRFVAECGGRLFLAAAASGGTRCRVELPAAAPTLAAEMGSGR